jgi:hypothetical protein
MSAKGSAPGHLLVQRCAIVDGKIFNEYMGSTAFQCGQQPLSMERLRQTPRSEHVCVVTVGSVQVPVYIIGSLPNLGDYQKMLQSMVDGTIGKLDWTEFSRLVKEKAGIPQLSGVSKPTVQFWHDLENHVFFTLDSVIVQKMIEILKIEEKVDE